MIKGFTKVGPLPVTGIYVKSEPCIFFCFKTFLPLSLPSDFNKGSLAQLV